MLLTLGLAIWAPEPTYFVALTVLVALAALREYILLAEKAGISFYKLVGYTATIAYVYAFSSSQQHLVSPITTLLLIGTMLAALIDNWKKEQLSQALASASGTLLGVLYLGFLPAHLTAVRTSGGAVKGAQLLSLFFLVIAASDSGAYFVGRLLGRHKLAPKISPGKTVQGAFGSLFASIAAALLCRYLFYQELPLTHALVLGGIFSLIGQAGDLFESLLKRAAGAKDAANLIPGHGGILDRLDSVAFNAPLLLYYMIFFT